MKLHVKLLATAATLSMMCGSAALADGMLDAPKHGSLKDTPVVEAPATWTGRYIGATLGGATGRFDNRTCTSDVYDVGLSGGALIGPNQYAGYYFYKGDEPSIVCAAGNQKAHGSSFIGGAQIGYNKQSGRVLFGVEGDFSGMRLHAKTITTTPYGTTQPDQTFTITSNVSGNNLFTLRGRLGLINDNLLIYGTAGLAVTSLQGSFSFTDTNVSALETGDFRKLISGYALGGGIEKLLGEGWSVKGEYLHLGFGRVSTTSSNFGGIDNGTFIYKPQTVMTHSSKLDADIFRIGINRRF